MSKTRPLVHSIPQSHYTRTPNHYFDHMPHMSNAEFRVVGAAIRAICDGGHPPNQPQPMSMRWFVKHTGLSETTVRKGVRQALLHGWLIRVKLNNRNQARGYLLANPA